MVGNAADEVDGGESLAYRPVDTNDVSLEELAEAVNQEAMDGRMFSVSGAEGAEAGKESVG